MSSPSAQAHNNLRRGFALAPSRALRFIIYQISTINARVTANCGNATIFGAERAVFDTKSAKTRRTISVRGLIGPRSLTSRKFVVCSHNYRRNATEIIESDRIGHKQIGNNY